MKRQTNGCRFMSSQPSEETVDEGHCSKAWCPYGLDNPANLDPGPRMLRHFSHRCRNSLSGIKLGLYLLKRELEDPSHSRWNDLGRTYDEIEKLFVGLERMYQPKALTLVRSPLGQLFAERLPLWRARYPDWSQTILFDPPQREIPGDFDPSHLALGLDAFVSWRAESGDSREPCVAWRTSEAHCEIFWRETSGPAGKEDRRADDSPLGCQLADCTGSLALLLLARVAADHRGELETQREPALSVTIRWPRSREVPGRH